MQLSDRGADRVDPLSGGMKRRLTIARSLINDPELLLLDEPTTGLDPQARHLLWERFYQLKRRGVTTVLTTHYMEEAEQLCDRLVIMDGGRIVAAGAPRELVERYATREVAELRFFDAARRDEAVEALRATGGRVEALPDRVLVYTDDAAAVSQRVASDGIHPDSLYARRGTLEDVFLILTGRVLEE
jgi:lipooligosaccharide transport system ATP-binding protein